MPRVMTIGRIGTLGKCACQNPTSGVGKISFAGTRKKKRKHKGGHCIVSKRGKVFNCYSSATMARKIAKKLGKGFKVKR